MLSNVKYLAKSSATTSSRADRNYSQFTRPETDRGRRFLPWLSTPPHLQDPYRLDHGIWQRIPNECGLVKRQTLPSITYLNGENQTKMKNCGRILGQNSQKQHFEKSHDVPARTPRWTSHICTNQSESRLSPSARSFFPRQQLGTGNGNPDNSGTL